MSLENLKTKGFVNLVYPKNIQEAVKVVMHTWHEFVSLPKEILVKFPYSNDSAGVGLQLQEIEGKHRDIKRNFDVCLAEAEWLKRHAADIKDATTHRMVAESLKLLEIISPMVIQFAEDAEREFGLERFSNEVRESQPKYFLRFIQYPSGAAVGEETCVRHVDQSGITLHLGETGPGFQGLDLDTREWIDISFPEGQTVLIPSMQMQLRSNGSLTAFWHRVVGKPETYEKGRESVVLFVQLKDTKKYNKNKCGRLQEMPIGFNYGMGAAQFAEYFA